MLSHFLAPVPWVVARPRPRTTRGSPRLEEYDAIRMSLSLIAILIIINLTTFGNPFLPASETQGRVCG